MDIITFVLACVGSVGTMCSAILTFIRNRVNIDFYIAEHSFTKDSVILYMVFTNKSHLPVSITDVKLWNKCIPYSCCKEPTVVQIYTRKSKNMVIYQEAIKSIPFPITLPCLSGASGYLYFQIPQENFECVANTLTVELNTNRHKTIQRTLSLSQN